MRTRKKWLLSLIVDIIVNLPACGTWGGDPGYAQNDAGLIVQKTGVVYTMPGARRGMGTDRGIEPRITEMIRSARKSIDMAFYQISLTSVINALAEAKARNVKIRLVGDAGENQSEGYYRLRRAGLSIVAGNTVGIQHNKFIIVDGKKVFTGTGNFTESGIYHNNNAFLWIEDEGLAAVYTRELDNMNSGLFGNRKPATTHPREFSINGYRVRVFFSPANGEEAVQSIANLVLQAEKSVHYMIFAFTQDELASAIIHAATRKHIPVYGIHDANFIRGASAEAPRIYSSAFLENGTRRDSGPHIRVDGNENYATPGDDSHGGKMHCKILITDAGTHLAKVAIGSFNWSDAAVQDNDENLLILEDPAIANYIYTQFQNEWAIAKDLSTLGISPSGNSGENSGVVISEIGWAGILQDGENGEPGERNSTDIYVELFHSGNDPVDLSHWSLAWGRGGFSSMDFSRIYPIPDKNNAYAESKTSCPGIPGFEEPQWNILCPGEHKIIFVQSSPEFMAWENGYSSLKTSPHLKISGSKNFRMEDSRLSLVLLNKAMVPVDFAGNGVDFLAEETGGFVRSLYRSGYRSHPSDGRSPSSWEPATDNLRIPVFSENGIVGFLPPSPDSGNNGFLDFTFGSPGYENSQGGVQ